MADSPNKKLNLSGFLPYRLSVLSNRISRAIANAYEKRFSLTIPEWRVMAIVGDEPELSATEVARRGAMDKVAVSRAVTKLIKAGRLKQVFAADDRRRSILSLTVEGRRVYNQVVPIARSFEDAVLTKISKRDRATLNDILSKLTVIEDELFE
jgi:DNA-binding MarR family transcriptional regulator